MAATKDFGVEPPEVAALSELDAIFALKEEQRAALKASLGGKGVFALTRV